MGAARKTTPVEYFVFHWGTQRNYPLKDSFVIGRSVGDFKADNDHMLSPQHCRISMTEKGILVEDLGSEHGTWVNDVQMEKGDVEILTAGARVIAGRQSFSLIVKGGAVEEEPLAKFGKKKRAAEEVEPTRFQSLFRRKPKEFEMEYDADSVRASGWTMRIVLMALTAFVTHFLDKNGVPELAMPSVFGHATGTKAAAGSGLAYEDLLRDRNAITTDNYHLVEEIRAGKKLAPEAIFQIEQRHISDLQKIRDQAGALAVKGDLNSPKAKILDHVLGLQIRKLKALAQYLGNHSKTDLNEMIRLEKEITNAEPALTAR